MMDENQDEELHIIKAIAKTNGYKTGIQDKIYKTTTMLKNTCRKLKMTIH